MVCTECGRVLENQSLVSDLQFVNKKVVGYFYNGDAHAYRLKKTLDSIQHVASVLCINARLVEAAKRYYKLVVEKRLTKGRRRKDLACACLYIACRVSGAPYLLIDFQNVVGRSMYAIGRVYVDIARALYLHIPVTDPSLFIGRFCSKL